MPAKPRSRPQTDRQHPPRQRLLDAADELFYTRGIESTGIDAVLRRASVARQSLYDHFGGKDGLITAYLARRDESFRAWFTQRLAALSPDPRAQLAGVFDVVEAFTQSPGFCGCAFIAAAESLADSHHPGRRLAAVNKRAVREAIIDLAERAGVAEPAAAGAVLATLIDGVLVAARMGPEDGRVALAAARRVAAGLIAGELAGPVRSGARLS